MRICDVTQFYSSVSGGVKRYLHGKIHYIVRETPHSHLLIVPGERDWVSGDHRSRTVQIVSRRIPGTHSYRLLLNQEKIGRMLIREKPDIIEVGDSYQLAWRMTSLGREFGIPVVAYYHSDYPRAFGEALEKRFYRFLAPPARFFLRKYLRRVFGRMDATLVASDRLLEKLRDWGLPNLRSAPMGVDTGRFHPREENGQTRHAAGVPPDRTFLLYVGRISADKNTRSLLSMMENLNRDQGRKFHLGVAGDGPQRDAFQAAAAKRDDISWFGYIDNDEEVACLYSAADLVVHPGTCETWGLTVLEAQACGSPVVAVRGGGTDELNLSGEEFLASSGSGRALAAAVERALPLLDPGRRPALAAEVRSRFDRNVCYGREIDIYDDVIRRYRAQHD
jgi:alpha-1,6-mannosyltransferase